jgi:hypothetical protein
MALILLFGGAVPGARADNLNPVDTVTGELWMLSSQEEKLAYLLGIESAISLEEMLSKKSLESKKEARAPLHNLSPFEKGWIQAFKGVTRKNIAARIDAWLKAHPERHKEAVLGIIWNELIVPNLPG